MHRPQVNLTLVAPGAERRALPAVQEAVAPAEEVASLPEAVQEEAAQEGAEAEPEKVTAAE